MAITIAHLGKSLEAAGKFFRLLEAEGLQDEALHVSINDATARAQLVQFWNMLAGSSSATPGYQRARDILGDDFISPQEVAEARGVVYTEEQLVHFAAKLPDKEDLQWARDNGFMVIAGPPRAMSLVDIHELNSGLFYRKSDPWSADECQNFARQDTVEATWLVLRKDPVPGSRFKTWDKQQDLLSDNERVPNVAETVWGFTTYAEVRGTRLVPNVYVRTSSVNSDGNRVEVGRFDGFGLGVGCYLLALGRRCRVGVSASRKF